jgi:hypothetical protein
MKTKYILLLSFFIFVLNQVPKAQDNNLMNLAFFAKGNFMSQTVHYYELDLYFPDKNDEMAGYALNASPGIAGNIPLGPSLAFYPRLGLTKLRGLRASVNAYYPNVPNPVVKLGGIAQTRYYLLSSDFLLKYFLPLGAQRRSWLYGGFRTDYLIWDNKVLYPDERFNEGTNKFIVSSIGGLGINLGKRFYCGLEYTNNLTSFIQNERVRIRYFSVSANLGVYLLN